MMRITKLVTMFGERETRGRALNIENWLPFEIGEHHLDLACGSTS
jgi:hypothetical protein